MKGLQTKLFLLRGLDIFRDISYEEHTDPQHLNPSKQSRLSDHKVPNSFHMSMEDKVQNYTGIAIYNLDFRGVSFGNLRIPEK